MFKIFLILSLFLFACDNEPEEKHGCVDAQACNYDPEATIDLFPENTCVYVVDCAGVCGGDGVDSDGDGVCDENE